MKPLLFLPILLCLPLPPLHSGEPFIRGEVTQDLARDLSDPLGIIGFLFLGNGEPACLESADVDDNGLIDVTDAINLLSYLFLGGSPPVAPYPACGQDPTPDGLGCKRFLPCGGGGAGPLFPSGRFPVGRDPSWLTIADLDGDGQQDALVSNSSSLYLSVLRGSADRRFQPELQTPVAETPYFHTLDDFNRDGVLDVVAAEPSLEGNAALLLGLGDGRFADERRFTVGEFPYAVAAGDVNADGKKDLVFSATFPDGDALAALPGNGDGTFGEARLTRAPLSNSLLLASLDGGPSLDLVTAKWSDSGHLSILAGRGDFSFWEEPLVALEKVNPLGLRAGDLDGNGQPDLVAASVYSGELLVLAPVAAGAEALRRFPTARHPWALALADLNQDGLLDGATANGDSDEISILLGKPDAGFGEPVVLEAPGISQRAIEAADLDLDGRPELLTANQGSNDVSVLWGQGDGRFRTVPPQLSFMLGGHPTAALSLDLDGDGTMEVVTVNSDPANSATVLLGLGDGTFLPGADFQTGPDPRGVAAGDLDLDGAPDLVVAHAGHVLVFLRGLGDGTFLDRENFECGTGATSVAVADFDGNGAPDVAAPHPLAGEVLLLLNSGNGNGLSAFPFCGSAPVGTSPSAVFAGDLDGDGLADLAIANESSRDVSVFPGSAQGLGRELERRQVGEYPRSIQGGDFTSDGLLDLITANAGTYDVSVLPARATGGFGEAVTADFFVGDIPDTVAAVDLDGDGVLDAATANGDGGDVTLLRGLGDGKFDLLERFTAGGNSRVLLFPDLNGDGRPDLVNAQSQKLVVILHR